MLRFAFSWPCCAVCQQCVWRDNQWRSALAGHPDREDPQQAYSLDSVPVTTWLWPSQDRHHSSQVLPASRLPTAQLSRAPSHQPGPPASQRVASRSPPDVGTVHSWLCAFLQAKRLPTSWLPLHSRPCHHSPLSRRPFLLAQGLLASFAWAPQWTSQLPNKVWTVALGRAAPHLMSLSIRGHSPSAQDTL